MKELTYRELLNALAELPEGQLDLPVRIADGRTVSPVFDTALSCECRGPSVALVGENYPLLIDTKPQASCYTQIYRKA